MKHCKEYEAIALSSFTREINILDIISFIFNGNSAIHQIIQKRECRISAKERKLKNHHYPNLLILMTYMNQQLPEEKYLSYHISRLCATLSVKNLAKIVGTKY